MTLEDKIVEWAKTRPAWQQEVMHRTATGERLSDDDYDQLVAKILTGDASQEVNFGLKNLPQASSTDPPVRLLSIAGLKHVNALASDTGLTFEPDGLTIVFGNNASGKSGYARLLKHITSARHKEEVLTDVFQDAPSDKPTANISVRIGDMEKQISWPSSTQSYLQRMRFYDKACENAYINEESAFPYKPSVLTTMYNLVEACDAVRERIDKSLTENNNAKKTLPTVPDEVKDTDAGKYLDRLFDSPSIETLDLLINEFDASSETVDKLKKEEEYLSGVDANKEKLTLTRQSDKIVSIRDHLKEIHEILGNDGITTLQNQRDQLKKLEEDAKTLTTDFHSEPLPGSGSTPWKELWKSAKQFSLEYAYPDKLFPVVNEDSRCVLCQQMLEEESRKRLLRFEHFVKDNIQVDADTARKSYDAQIHRLEKYPVVTEAITSNLKDLETTHADLIEETRSFFKKYQTALDKTIESLNRPETLPLFGIEQDTILNKLDEAKLAVCKSVEEIDNPEIFQKRRMGITAKRKKLELLGTIKKSRKDIIEEIGRIKEQKILGATKSDTSTRPITKKIAELVMDGTTKAVREAFEEEISKLKLEHVIMSPESPVKGKILLKPKLDNPKQHAKLSSVFSEGERNTLGLAALFTEVKLDKSRSAVILDDPVTSLDHIRRYRVAKRIVDFAKDQQVILFTHDVAFVADLKSQAELMGIKVADRTVERNWWGEKKPGKCSEEHPWKAKDASQRLADLRKRLTKIRQKRESWESDKYEERVAAWAGHLSETWERFFRQEIVGRILAEGGLEVRPKMVKILAEFTEKDYKEFNHSYSRVSKWTNRHDKDPITNFDSPEPGDLEEELDRVDNWFKRVKKYKD